MNVAMLPALLPFPDIGPDLFSFEIAGRTFALRWYALAYIVGLLVGMQMVRMLLTRSRLWPSDASPMPSTEVDDLLTYMIIGVILGGRLGFVLFYNFDYYLSNPLEIIAVWQGGMSFHGGFAGVILGTWLFCYRRNYPAIQVGDAVAWAATPGLFLGRLANFINGELWGRGTDAPWGVIFPDPRSQSCIEWGDQPCARHPSQLYEAALEGALLFLIMAWGIRRGWLKRPGTLIGMFFIGYGIARFFIEFFRQPDAQFVSVGNPLGLAYHIDGIGITMGQALSLPMVLVGAAIIFWPRRA